MKPNLKLSIELVPASAWSVNLRKLLKPKMWENLRKSVYQKYHYRCGICGSGGILHSHEVWEYDDKNHVQKLKEIIALCKMCHWVKHIGLAEIQESKGALNYQKLVKHFMKVNNCDRKVFEKHRERAFKKFEERSRYEWTLDMSDYKYKLP